MARVSRWIAAALGVGGLLGCQPSESEWVAELQAEDPFVRTLALVALEDGTWQDAVHVTESLLGLLGDESQDVRERARALLRAHVAEALPTVLKHVAASTTGLNAELEALIVEQGAAALPGLRQALEAPDLPGGPQLVWVLGRIGPAADETLIALCRSGQASIQLAAARALSPAATRSAAALDCLLELPRGNTELRRIVLPACVKALAIHLLEVDPARRRQAERRLELLGRPALPELLAQLDSPRVGVPPAVTRWFAERRTWIVPEVLAAFRPADDACKVTHYFELPRRIGVFGSEVVDDLIEELQSPEAPQRVAAAVALTGMGEAADPARPALTRLLDDPVAEVAVAAGYALLQLGLPESEIESLAGRARAQKGAAAYALGVAVAAQILRDVAGAPDAQAARQRAYERLRGLQPEAATWLLGIVRWSADGGLRLEAGRARELPELQLPPSAASGEPKEP